MGAHVAAPGGIEPGPGRLAMARGGVGLGHRVQSSIMYDTILGRPLTRPGLPTQEKMVDHSGGTELGGKETGGWTFICEESMPISKKA